MTDFTLDVPEELPSLETFEDSCPVETNSEETDDGSVSNNQMFPPMCGSDGSATAAVSAYEVSFAPEDTLIIFDWDDTLLPSSWISYRGFSIDPQIAIEEEERRILSALSVQVQEVLSFANALGRVTIVTNAEAGWVEMSAARFLPGVGELIKECSIAVVSARSMFESEERPTPFSWKAEAFWHLIFDWIREQPSNRQSSIDSVASEPAVQEVRASLVKSFNNSSSRPTKSSVSRDGHASNFCRRRADSCPAQRCSKQPQRSGLAERSRSFTPLSLIGTRRLGNESDGSSRPHLSTPTDTSNLAEKEERFSRGSYGRKVTDDTADIVYRKSAPGEPLEYGDTIDSASTCSTEGETPSGVPSDMRTVLSFGDSEAERCALIETCKNAKGVLHKSFKFCETPAPSTLFYQLRLIMSSLESLVHHQGVLDFKVNWSAVDSEVAV